MPKAAQRVNETGAAPQPPPVAEIPHVLIEVRVDWAKMDMVEAKLWYQRLKTEFENAGNILNARLTRIHAQNWTCFMAGKVGCCKKGITHSGIPRGTDLEYKDPETQLTKPVRVCSELCWLRYQDERITERRNRYIAEAAANQ